MTVDIEDTIVAIASAPGIGLRGIVRLSGSRAIQCIQNLFQIEVSHRRTQQLDVELPLDADLSLAGKLLIWPTNNSYTRQPSAEFHTLGSKPLLDLTLREFCQAGCRIARPGEFTLRAFLGGRLDLTQAEAVLALIDSAEQQQFDVALQQLAGGLANPLNQVRDQLVDLLAELEAGLDFVEEDIEFVSREQIIAGVETSLQSVQDLKSQIASRATNESVYDVVLVGWPNVGKSSLFNTLLKEDRAIVSDRAGTTRDYLTATVNRQGLQIRLIDTAGLEATGALADVPGELLDWLAANGPENEIEAAAQIASVSQLKSANLKLVCIDSNRELNAWENRLIETLADDHGTVIVLTKGDLERQIRFEGQHILTSAVPGSLMGISALWDQIGQRLTGQSSEGMSVVGATLSRCREHIDQVLEGLTAARDSAIACSGEEIVAAELHHALEQLGHIVGTVYTDDILDRIFGRFCIGK